MPKGTIVMLGLGGPPRPKGKLPPKFGEKPAGQPVSDKPLRDYERSNEPMDKEEPSPDAEKIATLASLAEHMGLGHVAEAIRGCEHEYGESPEKEAAEEEATA